MRDRTLTFIGSLGLATVAAAWLAAGSLAAQAAKPAAKAPAKPWTAPRTPDGKPDLSGFYDVATMTPVERPAGVDRLVLTPRKRRRWKSTSTSGRSRTTRRSAATARRRRSAARTTTPSRTWSSWSEFGGGAVGGYNNFWLAGGMTVIRVDGQARSSLVIDPPDGKVPPMKPEATKRNAAFAAGGAVSAGRR